MKTKKPRAELELLKNPKIKAWYDGVAPSLKASTRQQYLILLMRYFNSEAPETFLQRAEKDPKSVAVEIKGRIGEVYAKSMRTAHSMRYALKSLLEFYEVDVHLNGKVKVRRIRDKGDLKWSEAEKVISFCNEPYRTLFTFQLWSGLGEDEVWEIQRSTRIQKAIEQQRSKPYVKVDLEPRKSNLDEFYSLIPTELTPRFPLKTRTGKPLTSNDVIGAWRRAAEKAGFYKSGFGPHQLRSAFRSQCAKAEVSRSIAEFFMGHGGGDKYGYSREVLDEEYAAKEIEKLWTYNRGGSREAYADLQAQLKELREKISLLEKEYAT